MSRKDRITPIGTDFEGVFKKEPSGGGWAALYTRREGRYRPWDPRRSKLSAYIQKGAPVVPFKRHSHVLYLGAASGTTASHVSDICNEGMVYCVEVSKRSFRDLINTCEKADNMVPLLANARIPNSYASLVGRVDIVYQDIAQRDQTEIFLKNLKFFLGSLDTGDPNDGGPNGLLMVKSRSIDVASPPKKVFKRILKALREEVEILDSRTLDPFEKDHLAVLVRWEP